MSFFEVLEGDCRDLLPMLPSDHVQCVVTSPPYWGLRKYGEDPRELGSEKTFQEYLENMTAVFEEVRRVLRPDGTLWLNMGDSYSTGGNGGGEGLQRTNRGSLIGRRKRIEGIKHKDLIGQPWALAFALRAAGWYLRQDIIWAKPNPMPESVTDRPTRAHEYLFLMSKSKSYFYDAEAIAEPQMEYERRRRLLASKEATERKYEIKRNDSSHGQNAPGENGVARSAMARKRLAEKGKRNSRSVWQITNGHFAEAHYATFPPALVLPCILAGSRPGDLVMDSFSGAGTVGKVCLERGRQYLGIELYAKNHEITERRVAKTQPGLALA
ncbi:MAG TPA: site-specific DNA-methyltransferase [bacterium]|nr:site-specific DNA-methyltransferase [bacterium]